MGPLLFPPLASRVSHEIFLRWTFSGKSCGIAWWETLWDPTVFLTGVPMGIPDIYRDPLFRCFIEPVKVV